MGTAADFSVPRPSDPSDGGLAGEWYIDAGGRVEGPFDGAELKARAADGRLVAAAGVSRDRATWQPAGGVPGLTFPPRPRVLSETVVSGSAGAHLLPAASDTAVVPVVSVPGYQLLDTLGSGACGVVYKARHERLNRVVALKTVLMPERASPDLMERFKQEAVALARLQHPNVVAVYDCGPCETPPGQVFFAMELLAGEDLDRRIGRDGPLDERTAWLVARQAAAALAHAADLGIVHRDVKPANLFLVPPPTGFPLPPGVPMVKVTDFGLALVRDPDGAPRQTAAGVLLGTPIYMAPEQFVGSDVDVRADIYSLGVSVFHALTGHPPYDGNTVYELIRQKAGPPPRLGPAVAAATADLVAAMMAERAADRPADYAALLAAIDALPCLAGGFGPTGAPTGRILPVAVAEPRPAAPAAPARRRRWYAAAVVAAVVAGGAVVWGAFARTAAHRAHQPEPTARYAIGAAEPLFDGRSVLGWAGPGLEVENDDEKKAVLVIATTATHRLAAGGDVRVILAIDRYRAASAEVVVAADPTGRWLVRGAAKVGVALGRRANGGAFEPAGAAIPWPPPKANQPPYLEVKYERAGDRLAAWFDAHPLGQVTAAGSHTTEVRVTAVGGPVRIESAEAVELVAVTE